MRIPTLTTAAVIAFAVIGAHGAIAQNTSEDSSEAELSEKLEDIVEGGKKSADGALQPSTGRAKPVENWFGCKPNSTEPHCKTKNVPATEEQTTD